MTTTKTSDQGTKTKEGRSTREVILAAATRLIHVHGYNHTTLDDILRESGVGKGNFYYHFKSKEDLGYAILDQIVAEVFLALEVVVEVPLADAALTQDVVERGVVVAVDVDEPCRRGEDDLARGPALLRLRPLVARLGRRHLYQPVGT